MYVYPNILSLQVSSWDTGNILPHWPLIPLDGRAQLLFRLLLQSYLRYSDQRTSILTKPRSPSVIWGLVPHRPRKDFEQRYHRRRELPSRESMNESDLHPIRLCRICVGLQHKINLAVPLVLQSICASPLGLTTFLVLKSSVLGSCVAIHNSTQTLWWTFYRCKARR